MAFNRVYEIAVTDYRHTFRNFIVGDFNDAGGRRITRDLEPEDVSEIPASAKIITPPLQMQFSLDMDSEGSSEGTSKAELSIYNLNEEIKSLFARKGAYVRIRAGYEDEGGLRDLFQGQVVHAATAREGSDRVTHILLKESFQALGLLRINKKYPQNTPFFFILQDLVKLAGQAGLSRGYIQEPNYNARAIAFNLDDPDQKGEHTIKSAPTSYIAEGYWRDCMDEVCQILSMTWYVINSKIYVVVGKRGRTSKEASGYGVLIYPKHLKSTVEPLTDSSTNATEDPNVSGIKFTTFLAPNITPASYIDMKVEGWVGKYKVSKVSHSLDYRGNTWDTEVEALQIG